MTSITDNGFARISKETLIRDPSTSWAIDGNSLAYDSSTTLNEKIDSVEAAAWTWDMLKSENLSWLTSIATARSNLWLGSAATADTSSFAPASLSTTKQDTLVSWTNIKTINWDTVLGSWDLVISSTISSIVWITWTKAEFNTAVTDGNIVYVWDSISADNITDGTTNKTYTSTEKTKLAWIAAWAEVNVNADWNSVSWDSQILNKPTIPTQYTNEEAQDAVWTILTDTSTIDFTYNDGVPSITADIINDSVTFTKVQNINTNRILGRSSAWTWDIEELNVSSIPSLIGLGTTDSPHFSWVNVGHATDTTITRVSGWRIAVEWVNVMMVGDAPTSHTHTSSDITDFNSASRAQTEAELVAWTNITITPSWTGATRQLTIASTAGGGWSGDVVWPASATDNAIARFDATTGKLIQNSVVTVSDTWVIITPQRVEASDLKLSATWASWIDTQGWIIFRWASKWFYDTSWNESLLLNHVASPVNEFTVSNAATWTWPTLEATWWDTNIDININPKGTGRIKSGWVVVPTLTSSDALTNKSISLWTNTITTTKAQLNTAVTDGDVMYIGDAPTAHNQTASTITDFTEASQDAIGAMVDTTLTYVDTTPLLQRAALTWAITASAGSNTTALGSFTTAQLNTALSDNDITTGGGTATWTNTGDQTITLTWWVTGSGTWSFAATVVTNANLTWVITSVGNATSLGSFTSANLATALTDETGSGANVFATSPTLVTPILGTPTSGTLTNCTVDWVDSVWFRNIPQNSQSVAYTAVLADAGKHIYHPSADTTARTWTIPANSSVAYPIGTALTFVNDTSAWVLTIAITTDTLVLAWAGTTWSRTLAANGMATAIKVTSTRWMISGTNLT